MTATFDFDPVEGINQGTFSGQLTVDGLKRFAGSMQGRVRGPDVRILWDLREAWFDFESAEVRDLAEFTAQLFAPSQVRSAFLASQDLEFAVVGMFVVFREAQGARVSVFREKQKAIEWLMDDGGREPGTLERQLLDAVRSLRNDLSRSQRSTSLSLHSLFTEAGLTRREEEIASALIQRGGADELSALLGVSRHTIRNHQRKIYSKLGVRSEAGLLRKCLSELTSANG